MFHKKYFEFEFEFEFAVMCGKIEVCSWKAMERNIKSYQMEDTFRL